MHFSVMRGLFTAGSATGIFKVRATSVADPSAFGEATVTITGPVAAAIVADSIVLGVVGFDGTNSFGVTKSKPTSEADPFVPFVDAVEERGTLVPTPDTTFNYSGRAASTADTLSPGGGRITGTARCRLGGTLAVSGFSITSSYTASMRVQVSEGVATLSISGSLAQTGHFFSSSYSARVTVGGPGVSYVKNISKDFNLSDTGSFTGADTVQFEALVGPGLYTIDVTLNNGGCRPFGGFFPDLALTADVAVSVQ